MASAVATDFTNQVIVTDEVAEFSPEVVAEMESHLAKYPPEQQAFGIDSAFAPWLFSVSAVGLIIRA